MAGPTLPDSAPRVPVAPERPVHEVADIFRQYGAAYRLRHALPRSHLKVMHAIEVCRTAALGGHVQQCDTCGFQQIADNSCRNRHCPKCQALTKAQWLADRQAELLPVSYFHAVFTLPHELNPLALTNQEVLCNLLFKAVSQTLLAFGQDAAQDLGGRLGFTAVLHTWDQRLRDHFHLHGLIPAGALSLDGQSWIPAREHFLFPVQALSKVFRGKFLDYLQQAFQAGQLQFPGPTADRGTPAGFSGLLESLRRKDWVVYCKEVLPGPEHVLDYLGRYTHRIAIANHRIVAVENGQVTFTYRDRREENRRKEMTLTAEEFIRRFLLHVLPDGFVRIRHFGFLANRHKKEHLERIRSLLGAAPPPPAPPARTTGERMLQLTGVDIERCPACQQGTLITIREILPSYGKGPRDHRQPPQALDSS